MRKYMVTMVVNVPDGVDAEEYLNEVSFDANHPDDGDIYDSLVDDAYTAIAE